MSEGTKDLKPGEGPNQLTLEEMQSQLDSLTASLDSEKKSKERILKESKEYKEGFQTFKKEKEELASKKALEEEDRLKKEGQFNVLLEQRESQIGDLNKQMEELKGNLDSRDTAIVNFRKAAEFERALGGKLKKEAYWNHVDFDKIATNPETGAIDAHSLKQVTDGFIENYKELVDFGNTPNLPNGTPGKGGSLSYEQWKKLPLAERKVRMKDVK